MFRRKGADKPDVEQIPRPMDPDVPGGVNVILEDAGPKHIQGIKIVRDFTGVGLKEAKALIDEAPSEIARWCF